MQYLGLGLFVIAEAIVFLTPSFYGNDVWREVGLIPTAGLMTLLLVLGITATRFHYPKRFFLYEGNPFNRKFCRSWFYYLQYDLWLFAWIGFCLSHGFICCRFGSLYHF